MIFGASKSTVNSSYVSQRACEPRMEPFSRWSLFSQNTTNWMCVYVCVEIDRLFHSPHQVIAQQLKNTREKSALAYI